MTTIWATAENKELAANVVDAFLPNSAATLRALADNAAMVASEKRKEAWEAPRWQWPELFDSAERWECIAARFREVLTWEPMTAY